MWSMDMQQDNVSHRESNMFENIPTSSNVPRSLPNNFNSERDDSSTVDELFPIGQSLVQDNNCSFTNSDSFTELYKWLHTN